MTKIYKQTSTTATPAGATYGDIVITKDGRLNGVNEGGVVNTLPGYAAFSIAASVLMNANTYTQVILNKTIINNIHGCTLNPTTGLITVPAGTYIVVGYATFGGGPSAVQVAVYVQNPLLPEAARTRALIGAASNSDDKTVCATTMFTITESKEVFLGAKVVSSGYSLISGDQYTHIEIMKIG